METVHCDLNFLHSILNEGAIRILKNVGEAKVYTEHVCVIVNEKRKQTAVNTEIHKYTLFLHVINMRSAEWMARFDLLLSSSFFFAQKHSLCCTFPIMPYNSLQNGHKLYGIQP